MLFRRSENGSAREDSRTDESEEILYGYHLGRSEHDDCWRLYLSPDLSRYLEFEQRHAVDVRRLDNGRVMVCLAAQTETRERVSDSPASFLAGDFHDAHAGSAVPLPFAERRIIGVADAGCGSAASCFTTAGPNCPGPEHPGEDNTTAFTCGSDCG